MIHYSCEELIAVQRNFPNLFYVSKENAIAGEINFSNVAYKLNRRGGWVIEGCTSDNPKHITDCYEIKILLNPSSPNVFETACRIKNLAVERKREPIDLHLYPDVGSCCLGLFLHNPTETLSEFVKNKVYPYFVWQAYYEKYNKTPPVGEYPHDKKGIDEFIDGVDKMSANDFCYCMSGAKYKNCCEEKIEIGIKKIQKSTNNDNKPFHKKHALEKILFPTLIKKFQ